jgi:hypothetical protein
MRKGKAKRKNTIRRTKAKRKLIYDIKFTLILGLIMFAFFGGMFGYWLIFGY